MYPVQCNPRTIRTGVGRPWASWRRSSSSVPPGKASSGPSLGSLGPVATPTIIRGGACSIISGPGGWGMDIPIGGPARSDFFPLVSLMAGDECDLPSPPESTLPYPCLHHRSCVNGRNPRHRQHQKAMRRQWKGHGVHKRAARRARIDIAILSLLRDRNIRSRRPRLLLPNPSADTGNAKESCIPQRRPREPTGCRKNPPPETPVAGFRRALTPRFSPKIAPSFT